MTDTGTADESIAALDIESGEQLWAADQRELDRGSVRGTRTVNAVTAESVLERTYWHRQYTDSIRAYDLSNGDREWTIQPETDTSITLTPPVVAGSRLYCVAIRNLSGDEHPSELRVHDVDTGTLQTTQPLEGESAYLWPPVVADGTVFVASTAGVEAFA